MYQKPDRQGGQLSRNSRAVHYAHPALADACASDTKTRPDTTSGRVILSMIRSLTLPVLRLSGERRAAAAASCRVRILEREAGAHDVRDVIDLDSVQVLRAEHIDEQ